MTFLDEFRAHKDDFFRTGNGPLSPAQAETFHGLRYYPERPDLVFEVQPEIFPQAELVEMQTSTGHIALYARWAHVTFHVGERQVSLTVYRDPTMGHLFLPFQDTNAGGDTYGAGRYLEPPILEDGRIELDFNYCYNPYCAYNDNWSCPIPPPENHLDIPIEAGEMTYEGGH